MFCTYCGTEVPAETNTCPKCGKVYIKAEDNVSRTDNGYQQNPYQQQNQYQQNPYQQPYQQPYQGEQKTESSTMATLALVFSILGGWLGLVLAIVGLCTYKTKEYKTRCGIALGISIAWIVIIIILYAVIFSGGWLFL